MLASGSVSRDEVRARLAHGMGRYPAPIQLLATLAVDLRERGEGLGRGLVKDALLQAYQASELVGSRAVVTQAKDQTAKEFYERC